MEDDFQLVRLVLQFPLPRLQVGDVGAGDGHATIRHP